MNTATSTAKETESKIDTKTIKFQIKRQLHPEQEAFWEEYEVPYKPSLNIIALLMLQNTNPIRTDNQTSTPVAYQANCLEEVCGSCTMVINGKVRQACSALVDKLEQPIRIEPMSKFPVVRDLWVNRSRMFKQLEWIQAWNPLDHYAPIGSGPAIDPDTQQKAYNWSRCMTCGCCLESCPQWSADEGFIGPQAIAQAMLFNSHPTGKTKADLRVKALMDNGLNVCGNAQNCAAVCPKELDLIGAISEANWQATKQLAKTFFGRH
ncbi:MAG: succinate dehydrogenase iron-sulfur subunit [Candidatus Caenarcaniphilales bacterium]|nr:succinate dehydrogenase iron-sulfur subunit [Candidatus Caenarcaniphilales bacterium]